MQCDLFDTDLDIVIKKMKEDLALYDYVLKNADKRNDRARIKASRLLLLRYLRFCEELKNGKQY